MKRLVRGVCMCERARARASRKAPRRVVLVVARASRTKEPNTIFLLPRRPVISGGFPKTGLALPFHRPVVLQDGNSQLLSVHRDQGGWGPRLSTCVPRIHGLQLPPVCVITRLTPPNKTSACDSSSTATVLLLYRNYCIIL